MKLEMLLNMDAKLVLDDPTSVLEKCNRSGFYATGSRYVMGSVPETTDWDFMCEDTDDNNRYLLENGFYQKTIDDTYMDDASVGVWYHPDAPTMVQVVTKKSDHWKTCIRMWDIFKTNPMLYRDYFWKSNPRNPVDRNVVRERINAMMKFIKEGGL